MGQVANSESFAAGASGIITTNKSTLFRRKMDSLLLGGTQITIDLPAGEQPCPSSCKYNPTYGQYVGVNRRLCRSCSGRGFILEPRYTVYKCNRRWTNESLDQSENTGEKTIGGRIYGNFVRVKTVEAAWDHIHQSLGASIDGVKVKLYQGPRRTGWNGNNLYIVSWWERVNKTDG